jgi:hypothetical protein
MSLAGWLARSCEGAASGDARKTTPGYLSIAGTPAPRGPPLAEPHNTNRAASLRVVIDTPHERDGGDNHSRIDVRSGGLVQHQLSRKADPGVTRQAVPLLIESCSAPRRPWASNLRGALRVDDACPRVPVLNRALPYLADHAIRPPPSTSFRSTARQRPTAHGSRPAAASSFLRHAATNFTHADYSARGLFAMPAALNPALRDAFRPTADRVCKTARRGLPRFGSLRSQGCRCSP